MLSLFPLQTRKEAHLTDADFKAALGVDRDAFYKLAGWKQADTKKKAGQSRYTSQGCRACDLERSADACRLVAVLQASSKLLYTPRTLSLLRPLSTASCGISSATPPKSAPALVLLSCLLAHPHFFFLLFLRRASVRVWAWVSQSLYVLFTSYQSDQRISTHYVLRVCARCARLRSFN